MIHPIDWLISKLFPTMIVDDYRWQRMGVFPSSQLAATEAKKVWALGPAVRIIPDKMFYKIPGVEGNNCIIVRKPLTFTKLPYTDEDTLDAVIKVVQPWKTGDGE